MAGLGAPPGHLANTMLPWCVVVLIMAQVTVRLVTERREQTCDEPSCWRGSYLFVSAFLGAVLALSMIVPSSATAQSSQAQEIRASAFTLVGPDGTVLARLAPGGSGSGNLSLYDPAGTRRLAVVGLGVVSVYDQDGTTIAFRAGRTFEVSPEGFPPLNGVQLDPDGSISMLPPRP
jgi:hypothetical protein